MPEVKPIIILGAVGNCIDILDAINSINENSRKQLYKCLGFLDDNPSLWGKTIWGTKVLGPLGAASAYPDCYFVNGICSPFYYWKIESIIGKTGLSADRFETVIHPSASVSKMSRVGAGTVIFQNVTVTSNVTIGNHVIILPNSIVSHDDVIGDYTTLTGGVCISGEVQVGKLCYLGTNSSVIGHVKIGDRCLIGMGSVVLRDIPQDSVVVGNPAKPLRHTYDESMKDAVAESEQQAKRNER